MENYYDVDSKSEKKLYWHHSLGLFLYYYTLAEQNSKFIGIVLWKYDWFFIYALVDVNKFCYIYQEILERKTY